MLLPVIAYRDREVNLTLCTALIIYTYSQKRKERYNILWIYVEYSWVMGPCNGAARFEVRSIHQSASTYSMKSAVTALAWSCYSNVKVSLGAMQVDLLAEHIGTVVAVKLPDSFKSQAQTHWRMTQLNFNTTGLVFDLCDVLESLQIPYETGFSEAAGLLRIDLALPDKKVYPSCLISFFGFDLCCVAFLLRLLQLFNALKTYFCPARHVQLAVTGFVSAMGVIFN